MGIILSHLSFILRIFYHYKVGIYILDSNVYRIKINVILFIIYNIIFESVENGCYLKCTTNSIF